MFSRSVEIFARHEFELQPRSRPVTWENQPWHIKDVYRRHYARGWQLIPIELRAVYGWILNRYRARKYFKGRRKW